MSIHEKPLIPDLEFRPIVLPDHMDTAMQFREDSAVVSFGDLSRFDLEHYRDWLKKRIALFPEGHVHVWVGEEIVGQIETRPLHSGQDNLSSNDPKKLPKQSDEGYVNLYYLAPKWRGRGLAGALDAYVVAYLKAHSCTCARLSVAKTNDRALRFYARLGWKKAGTRPDQPQCWWMTKDFGA